VFNLYLKKMKKVVLSFAVVAAFALASCGGKSTTTDAEQIQDQAPEVIEEVVIDTVVMENEQPQEVEIIGTEDVKAE
jgi:hypothetical protein